MSRIFRYAPSPTGRIHLGQVKAALIPYILAKKFNGKFILRIEDTDQKRNKADSVAMLLEDLQWLGITYDLGPENPTEKNEYFQSQRLSIYEKYINQLLAEDKAYPAYETPEERKEQIEQQRSKGQPAVYLGHHANLTEEERKKFAAEGRKPVIRLRVPKNQIITFKDEVFGEISVNTNQIGDIVIQKSDGTPMYNFAVVIDDHEMRVTDVVRGFGHLSNTSKQVLIYNIFNWQVPRFAHFSDIQNENQPGKLSKRYGAKSIAQFRAEGYLPEAIINYVVYISCSFHFKDKHEEIMNMDQIVEAIDYQNILKTNAKFNSSKLDWFNGQHIRILSNQDYIKRTIYWLENHAPQLHEYYQDFDSSLPSKFLTDRSLLQEGLMLVKERITKLSDIFSYLGFLFNDTDFNQVDITPTGHTREEFEIAREKLYNVIQSLQHPWTHREWESKIREAADSIGWRHADLFMALRLMIVGSRYSPPLFESMVMLGIDKCLKRINRN
jgi:glutamyl-tRNA synthetase